MSAESKTPTSSPNPADNKPDTKQINAPADEKAIAALLTSADCLHHELPITDKAEQHYLAQLTAALAENSFNEDAYSQLFTRLKTATLSLAATYRFANLCYRYWQREWPTANTLQTQQAAIERQMTRLQALAQERTLFRRPGTPVRYYWGQSNATNSTTAERGQFYICYPDFESGQGGGVTAIYQAEAITDAADIATCEAYVNVKRVQQLTDQMRQHSTVLWEKLQQYGHHSKLIVNLQLADLYYRSGPIMRSLTIHEMRQAVFYFRQAMGEIAHYRFTRQQPPLATPLITAAEQLRSIMDHAIIKQAQTTLFTAKSAVLLARWMQCYQEPTLELIYQLTQETTALLAHTTNVPPTTKQPLIDAWLTGFNHNLAEDGQEVRAAMQNAITGACNPAQKYPYSLATIHQWLLRITQQLQQHGETSRVQALLHAYQQLLINKQPNLQQNFDGSTGPIKTAYNAILVTCEQVLKDLDQRLLPSSVVAETKTPTPPNTPESDFDTRTQELDTWHQTLTNAFVAGTKTSDIYTANTETARKLVADICHEIEQQIGPPPCAYTLMGAGSFSRGEVSPASDLDCAVLVADATVKTVDKNDSSKVTLDRWFQCFLQLMQWKLASLPAGILALEKETVSWITKGFWFDTPKGFIQQHLASQQPNNSSNLQQPENFGAQWFRWIYSSRKQLQEKDVLFGNYQKALQKFFHPSLIVSPLLHTPIDAIPLPAYRQLAPWSLKQHLGESFTPTRKPLAIIPTSTPGTLVDSKESKHKAKDSLSESPAETTFTVLNVKHLSYRLINAILCYGRFNDIPSGITSTHEVLTYLKTRQFLPSSFIARLETALDQLYTWRLRQHWAWLHHDSELGENEVMLWPEDLAQQTALRALHPGWRGFYLDEIETQQYVTIVTTVAEVIGRSIEGFAMLATQLPTSTMLPSEHSTTPISSSSSSSTTTTSETKEVKETKHKENEPAPPSSHTTTTTPEAKREASEEEAQVIIAAQARSVAEIQTFNPLSTAVEWTLQQLISKPDDSKTSTRTAEADKVQVEHVQWLAQVMDKCAEELSTNEPHSNDPAVKQDPLFRCHWQVYWKIPTPWRSLYLQCLRQNADSNTIRNIIEPLFHAPNQVGWRLATQEQQNQWQHSLRSLSAQNPVLSLPEAAQADIEAGKAVWIQWIENHQSLWAPLKPEHANVLLVSDAKSTRWQPKTNAAGNHHVYRLKTDAGYFWVKRYPEQATMGDMIATLGNRLGIDQTPPQQLMALHHAPLTVKNGTAAGMTITRSAIVISKHAADPSKNLQTLLEKQSSRLAKLDFISFIKTLLRVLLTNPEDDKANDYFLVRIPSTDIYVLVRIDNERAFLPVSYFSKGWIQRQEELQVKSIVYCLDQMLTAWDSDPRVTALLEDLRQLQPSTLIVDLLQEMNILHNDLQQLFPLEAIHQHACLQEPWMSLPTPMLPRGIESVLLKRLTSLQTALRSFKPSEITGLKLLEIVQPELAKFYNISLFQGKFAPESTPTNRQANARFEQVAGRYYQQQGKQADYRTTRVTSPAIFSRLSSVVLPDLPKTAEDREKLKSFAQAVYEKKANSAAQAVAAVEQWRDEEVTKVKENLLASDPDPAKAIRIRETARIQFGLLPGREQQRVIEQIFASKSGTTLTLQEQHYLLTVLVGAQCHNLDFRPFKAILTNELLLLILHNANKQILALNLSGCTKLRSNILQHIERYCPYLKRLRINDQTGWESLAIGNFAGLTTLECNQATSLTDIRFGRLPKLKKLSLANASQLQILGNQGLGVTSSTEAWPLPQLQQLNTKNCALLRVVHIKVDKPQSLIWESQGCAALMMPSIYFWWIQEPATLVNGLARAFKANSAFVSLDLQNCNIDERGAQILAEALKAKLPITSLDLSENYVGDVGAAALADALKFKPPLTSLNLSKNYITSVGAEKLAEALKTNPPLVLLNLDGHYVPWKWRKETERKRREEIKRELADIIRNKDFPKTNNIEDTGLAALGGGINRE